MTGIRLAKVSHPYGTVAYSIHKLLQVEYYLLLLPLKFGKHLLTDCETTERNVHGCSWKKKMNPVATKWISYVFVCMKSLPYV